MASAQEIIAEITKDHLRHDLPEFGPGDTVRVHAKVVEGNKERIQVFEGVVIARKHGGISETFTVRKISHGKVRRAKLYYLRKKVGKAARIKELRTPR